MLRILHGHKGLHSVGLSQFNGIELDLRMTRDNRVVLSHDRRITDGNGWALWIDRFAYSDIERITDQKLLPFDEALITIQKKLRKPEKKLSSKLLSQARHLLPIPNLNRQRKMLSFLTTIWIHLTGSLTISSFPRSIST